MPDYDTVQNMEYLDMVLSESLRLYPPATRWANCCHDRVMCVAAQHVRGHKTLVTWLKSKWELLMFPCRFARECNEACTINGIHFPKGMMIFVPVYALHRDPEYWPDPEKFEPERYSRDLAHLLLISIWKILFYLILFLGTRMERCLSNGM